MTERKYKRAEFEAELDEIESVSSTGAERDAAIRRLLSWFDEVQFDLGHVGALYDNLKRVTGEKVAAEVRAEGAEQRVYHLERQLAAKRVENNELDSERNDGDE